MKRTERHHLKEDEIRTGLSRFVHFVKTWQREISISAAVLAGVVLIVAALFALKAHQTRVQSRIAGEILSLAAGLDENPDNLAKLEESSGRGKFGRLGYLELAKHWIAKGDLEKAGAYLDKFPKSPRDLIYYQAQDLKAQVAVHRKDFDTAVAIYREIENDDPSVYPLDAALFHLAEVYELKGELQEAKDLYAKIQQEYTQTYYGYEASVKTGRLDLGK
jgi:predicted negative regulator of RcsB-dependent stress response